MKKLIRLQVNGEAHELAVNPDETLLQVLRGQLDLIGPKKGCDSGGCGCCTVELDGKAIYACMKYAASADGGEITTAEGLSQDGELHVIQQAFVDAGAVQCGYCTCGMMMAARQLVDTVENPGEDEIRQAISGNLCRCTGYVNIVKAVQHAAATTDRDGE
ncbi:MAG: (2Fe-2S)-binding protein [Gammaproteobacteria bacterium]